MAVSSDDDGEEGDGAADLRRPDPIPCNRTKREARRVFCPAPICLGRLLVVAMRRRTPARARRQGEQEEGRERARREQVSVGEQVVVCARL